MKVRFWGVRGSIPVPGRATNRYGGNTSCVEVRPKARRADHHRCGHRHSPARQVADGGRVRRRQGQVLDPDQPHALGSRPGPAVLLAALSRRQPDPHLRAPARHAPRGGVQPAAQRAVLPGAARGDAGRDELPRADRRRIVRHRQREGHVRAPQPSVGRDRVSRRRRRRGGRLLQRHRAVHRHAARPRLHRAPDASARCRRRSRTSSRDARRRGRAREERRSADLRHAVHARRVQVAPALGPLAPRRRDRDRARGEGQDAVPVPPRADALRRRERRDPRAVPRGRAGRQSFELVSAYEGLEITLGDST